MLAFFKVYKLDWSTIKVLKYCSISEGFITMDNCFNLKRKNCTLNVRKEGLQKDKNSIKEMQTDMTRICTHISHREQLQIIWNKQQSSDVPLKMTVFGSKQRDCAYTCCRFRRVRIPTEQWATVCNRQPQLCYSTLLCSMQSKSCSFQKATFDQVWLSKFQKLIFYHMMFLLNNISFQEWLDEYNILKYKEIIADVSGGGS